MPTVSQQLSRGTARRPAALVGAQTAGCVLVILLIGALSAWASERWLVASLGPSVLIQTLSPEQKVATMWDTGVSQLIGLASGFVAVFAVGAQAAPALASGHPLVWARVLAAALAFVLLVPGQRALKAPHPPAGAAALLVALGIEPPSWHTAWVMAVGIGLVTVFGQCVRLAVLRVGHPS